jgi:hypothetical protein
MSSRQQLGDHVTTNPEAGILYTAAFSRQRCKYKVRQKSGINCKFAHVVVSIAPNKSHYFVPRCSRLMLPPPEL